MASRNLRGRSWDSASCSTVANGFGSPRSDRRGPASRALHSLTWRGYPRAHPGTRPAIGRGQPRRLLTASYCRSWTGGFAQHLVRRGHRGHDAAVALGTGRDLADRRAGRCARQRRPARPRYSWPTPTWTVTVAGRGEEGEHLDRVPRRRRPGSQGHRLDCSTVTGFGHRPAGCGASGRRRPARSRGPSRSSTALR